MRFGPWYPLDEAGDRAPGGPNVLQLRLAHGLHDYPRGKSAMVRYLYADDAQAAARGLAMDPQLAGRDLVCRHLIELDGTDLPAFYRKLRDDFERRFGAVPVLEP